MTTTTTVTTTTTTTTRRRRTTSNSSNSSNNQKSIFLHFIVSFLVLLVFPSASFSFVVFARWGPPIPSSSSPARTTRTSGDRRSTVSSTTTVSVAADIEKQEQQEQLQSLQDADDDDEKQTKNLRTVDVLSLDSIRSSLVRQEETIIFALIERAQFRKNDIVYKKGGFGYLGIPEGSKEKAMLFPNNNNNNDDEDELSFMEYVLVGTESLHARVRRYTSPEEYAFFPERLPTTDGPLPTLQYPDHLLSSEGGADDVNINKVLLDKYVNVIVPQISKNGDDEQHGSTVLCDIAILQALSKRIHYGKFVAESKYRSDPDGYQKLVNNNDAYGVMELLTNRAVEAKVLRRAWLKAATYGVEPSLPPAEMVDDDHHHDGTTTAAAAVTQSRATTSTKVNADDDDGSEEENNSNNNNNKIDPAVIESIYRDIIIPMTKDIEVAYLFLRCGKQPPPEYVF